MSAIFSRGRWVKRCMYDVFLYLFSASPIDSSTVELCWWGCWTSILWLGQVNHFKFAVWWGWLSVLWYILQRLHSLVVMVQSQWISYFQSLADVTENIFPKSCIRLGSSAVGNRSCTCQRRYYVALWRCILNTVYLLNFVWNKVVQIQVPVDIDLISLLIFLFYIFTAPEFDKECCFSKKYSFGLDFPNVRTCNWCINASRHVK